MSIQDSANLNAARPLFGGDIINTGTDFRCAKFIVGSHPYQPADARVLAEAMMSAQRFTNEMCIWLDVTVQPTPSIVQNAVEFCAAFGLRLVVTEPNGRASLANYPPIDPALAAAVQKANRRGTTWDPISGQVVPM